MELTQVGRHVTGGYPTYGGRIEGDVENRELRGHWIEGQRSGPIIFVLSDDGRSFAGRFDDGLWWTGGRVKGAGERLHVDQSSPGQALHSSVIAGDLARTGAPDLLAYAVAVIDFGAENDPLPPGQKLERARRLFEVLDLTTFDPWQLASERRDESHVAVMLHQAGTEAVLPLTFSKSADGRWFIVAPDEASLSGARSALLARSGGRPPAADEVRRRASARDAFRSFAAGLRDWSGVGRAEALEALDLSEFSEATRDYEGGLAAYYLAAVMARVGILPQSIPDDPQSHESYVLFSHPAGSVTIAAVGMEKETSWKFTAASVRTARDLFVATEDLPLVQDAVVFSPPASAFFSVRRFIRGHWPPLLAGVGPLEAWQVTGLLIIAAVAYGLAFLTASGLTRLLRLIVGGREIAAEREFRWPLRLALACMIYRVAAPGLGLPEAVNRVFVGATGVLFAASVVWGGWQLIETARNAYLERTDTRAGTLDEMLASLVLTIIKLGLLVGGLIYIASALSLPYEGLIAGLGISGLAVAFASRETLMNVFGAGILVADRPFRRGDWITVGDLQGSVERVGIRSTRVRTADDSITVVPNSKLADATVNNLGTRRNRLIKAQIELGYETKPEDLERYLARASEAVAAAPSVLGDRTAINVASFAPNGVRVDLATYVRVRSDAEELAARNAIFVNLLRLAQEMGIRLGEPPMPILMQGRPVTAG
jgi:small-conductance mechanosensitive channel